MANSEHQELAQYIKDVHASLRKSSSKIGVKKAWLEHCNNKDILNTYAKCMEKLATVHWDNNCKEKSNTVISRIQWSADFCFNYFRNNMYLKYREKETDIAIKVNIPLISLESSTLPIKLLDVGSCYNPFKNYDYLEVLAIDLCPANDSVYECDFLNVLIGDSLIITNNKVMQLKRCNYDVITFCFLLEYIPNSELRIDACVKAYELLKPEGLLIINTPDSKHVGANSKLMKCWRYTLAWIGFSRIKYEKYKHMHCLGFRKSLDREIARRWTTFCKELYMECSLSIPQDFLSDNDKDDTETSENHKHTDNEIDLKHFDELPFSESM